jgi:hypothetical protein
MNLIDRIKKMPLGIKIACSAAAVALIVAVVVVAVLSRNGYIATTMRLLRVEGTVTIEDSKGGIKPVIDNIRFQSGDALSTGSDGLASVGLDDTKIITLQNDSRAEFTKQGKHLKLNLTKGAVFFNVTEKLQPDETFEIKTSTMTAGIRGTSGMVYYDQQDDRDSLIVTDGAVIVTATNPVTGVTRYAEVHGGQKITVYLYDDDVHEDVEFDLVDVATDDLDEFTLERLVEDEELLNRVCEYTGWEQEELKSFVTSIANGEVVGKETEVTLTVTPTPTITPVPTVTSKPTSTVTPTPSPTAGVTVTPTPVPAADATATPTATNTPSVTPTTTPIPTATSTPRPTATTTPKPTSTTTPKPTATTTPNPTITTTPEPSSTLTPVPSPITEPSEPEVKAGCKKTDYWGDSYEGNTIYICRDDDDNYYGYLNGEWVLLDDDSMQMADGVVFLIDGTYDEYYSYSWGAAFNVVPPDGYEKSHIWGNTYEGRTVYICEQTYTENGNQGTRYMGFYDDEWIELECFMYAEDEVHYLIYYVNHTVLNDNYYTEAP